MDGLMSKAIEQTLEAPRRRLGRKRGARRLCPPCGLRRDIAHHLAPLRWRRFAALRTVKENVPGCRVEISNGTQKPSLASPGRALDCEAIAVGHFEAQRRQFANAQVFDPQHVMHSFVGRLSCTCPAPLLN